MPRYDDTFVDRFLEPWNQHDVDGAFQAFIHELAVSGDAESLRLAFAEAGGALDLSCSAYLISAVATQCEEKDLAPYRSNAAAAPSKSLIAKSITYRKSDHQSRY